MVTAYLDGKGDYKTLAKEYGVGNKGITNPCMIAIWVRRFRVDGPDSLRLHKKGKKKLCINLRQM